MRLFLLEEATQLLRCRIGVGFPIEDQRDLTIPVGQSFSGHVAATRRPMAVSDTRNDPRLQHPAHAERHQLVSYLGLPVVHRDRLFGVFAFSTREPREYSENEIALLTAWPPSSVRPWTSRGPAGRTSRNVVAWPSRSGLWSTAFRRFSATMRRSAKS